MSTIDPRDPIAVAAAQAIHSGDVGALEQLLDENPGLATARLGDDDPAGMSRTLLHVATDWPGHFPNGPATIAALVEAGADVDARFHGPHAETPLHWAASSDDVEVLDALLDAGADIDAPGGVIGGGTPLADARAFGQWKAARRLVARGARVTLDDAATLGLMDRVRTIESRATRFAAARVIAFLGAPRIIASTMLTAGAVRDLEAAMPIVRVDTPPGTTPPILTPITTATPIPRPPAPTPVTPSPVALGSLTTGLVPRPGISRLVGVRAVLPPTAATLR